MTQKQNDVYAIMRFAADRKYLVTSIPVKLLALVVSQRIKNSQLRKSKCIRESNATPRTQVAVSVDGSRQVGLFLVNPRVYDGRRSHWQWLRTYLC